MPLPSVSSASAAPPSAQAAAPVQPASWYARSVYERCLHAVLFELLALLLCAPLMSWLARAPVTRTGTLTVMISMLAMLWNMLFNSLFDRLAARWQWPRGWRVRLLHALAFETGLLLAVVPLAACWLNLSLFAALLLDIGLVLFFLPYTMLYNWCYDQIRSRFAGPAI